MTEHEMSGHNDKMLATLGGGVRGVVVYDTPKLRPRIGRPLAHVANWLERLAEWLEAHAYDTNSHYFPADGPDIEQSTLRIKWSGGGVVIGPRGERIGRGNTPDAALDDLDRRWKRAKKPDDFDWDETIPVAVRDML